MCKCTSVFGSERERERKRESGGKLRLQQHMLSIQKTYTVPLVNKVLGMPLGSNLDCDLRRCRGFVCGWACLEVCVLCIWAFFLDAPLKQYSGGSGWPSCTPPHLCPHSLSLSLQQHAPHCCVWACFCRPGQRCKSHHDCLSYPSSTIRGVSDTKPAPLLISDILLKHLKGNNWKTEKKDQPKLKEGGA